MDRRGFLKAATSGVAAATWPGWLRKAVADVSVVNPMSGAKNVKDAIQRGRDLGKPLLVFVVPPDAEKWERGHLFGEFLNNAIDPQMALLSLAELVCATVDQLAGVGIAVADRNAKMLVVEPGAGSATAIGLQVEALSHGRGREPGAEKNEDRLIDRRVAEVARAVKGALAADPAMVARRAAAVRAKNPKAANAMDQALVGEGANGAIDDAKIEGAAAIALEQTAVESDSLAGPLLVGRLAAYAKRKWRKQPPPGSKWASSWGCGTNVEGEAPEGVACGMGHVPAKSARFLYLFSKTPQQDQEEYLRKQREEKKRGG